jgi:16S rRNA (cytosine1402-N4)-methyltransferase
MRDEKPVHLPVLLAKAVELLACSQGKLVVDATVGGGGHAQRILELIGERGVFIGLDRDEEALGKTRSRLGARPNVTLVHENFRNIKKVLDNLKIPAIDALLLDLGLSSFQVDDPRRGFSFRHEGPLDMRMDTRQKVTAADIVNTYSEKQLTDILRRYGEEPRARVIAKAIVRERTEEPILSAVRLAEIIQSVVPRGRRPSRIHPATLAFQALRIEVNSELDNLAVAVDDGVARLRPGGRICIISFHSLEDRIVKQKFAAFARGCICPAEIPQCMCGKKPILKILTPKPIQPAAEEVAANPRSRSARLRAAEKIAEDTG